jgi:nitrogen regulatory protein P-II 2
MALVPLKLVTIVAEAVLADRIIADIKRIGARGYTLTEVKGEGTRGVRASEWEGKSVSIQTIVGPVVAERIVGHLAETYFRHYAVVAYVQTVEVARAEKYL